MCGIAGIFNYKMNRYPALDHDLYVMNKLQAHRGPDDDNIWTDKEKNIGFGHRRLSIIDLVSGKQPMIDEFNNVICFNGEIYNYIELKEQLSDSYKFKTSSDTEVILASYRKWGIECVNYLRGMFAFAIWDEKNKRLLCARDRFGIKPFYYSNINDNFYFSSEAKALLPFQNEITTDLEALKDYFVFQLCLGNKTLFSNIKQLLPAHILIIENNEIRIKKYWEVNYYLDWEHTENYFQNKVRELLEDSVKLHLRSDVPVGAYISGGIDSSLISSLAKKYNQQAEFKVFHGKFSVNKDYDESEYAQVLSNQQGFKLFELDIQSHDFKDNIRKVIYHLDYPVAGPGAFPQYMVSELAGKNLKVVLGGQGGDEVFGGYVRYLLAYFEQCIKGAIDNTLHTGNFIVTYESIIPNLQTLQGYKSLIKEFWSEGIFDERDKRYFRLVNRANTLKNEVRWDLFEPYSAFKEFKNIFWGENIEKESYFDSMTHFDFKTLLPALLQVEDRMSMAHGLESRVPILDHPLIEFMATVPSNVKFQNGELKHLIKTSFKDVIPEKIMRRKDKMGFPVPMDVWMKNDLFNFILNIFSDAKAAKRDYLNPDFDIHALITEDGKYSRKLWGFLCLELWQQEFHDKADYYKKLVI